MQTTKYLSEVIARGWLRSTEAFSFLPDLHLPVLLKIKPAENPAELKHKSTHLKIGISYHQLCVEQGLIQKLKEKKNQINRKYETKNQEKNDGTVHINPKRFKRRTHLRKLIVRLCSLPCYLFKLAEYLFFEKENLLCKQLN